MEPPWLKLLNLGLQNGAAATIQVVGPDLKDGTTMAQNAANNWTTMPGATYTFNTQSVTTPSTANATAAKPVIVLQIGDPSRFADVVGADCPGAFMCTQPSQLDAQGHVVSTLVELNPKYSTANANFQGGFDHELGHGAFGLDDCNTADCTQSNSVMTGKITVPTDMGPRPCDATYVYRNTSGSYGSSTVSTGGGGTGGSGGDIDCSRNGTRQVIDDGCNTSPIIIDTEGEGFHLTSATNGVQFDIAGNGNRIQMAWTDSSHRNAFLCLPGPDGVIESGRQLFGNFTPQPDSGSPNGFIALALYDYPENGGNADGVIDSKDAIFSRLRLWVDQNHDGVSQADELYSLPDLGINSLSLKYFVSHREDIYGNEFRYRGKVNPGEGTDSRDRQQHGGPNDVGRWAYDVFLIIK